MSSPPKAPSAPAAVSSVSDTGAAADTRKDPAKAFLQIVSMLMRTAETKGLTLADLEWLVLPALRNHQTVIAEARDKDGAAKGPIGTMLWATVSPEVDARLSADRSVIPVLAPDDWKSGQIPWVIAAIGRPEVVNAMLDQVLSSAVPGRRIKVRSMTPEGAVVIKEVGK